MAKVENAAKVSNLLRRMADRWRSQSVAVGYTAAYALFVHENVEMKWKGLPRHAGMTKDGKIVNVPQRILSTGTAPTGIGFYWGPAGQAKFLEQPFRELAGELRRIIAVALKSGLDMGKSLMLAGLRLQRESQKLVPVEFGALKASAFTRLEG